MDVYQTALGILRARLNTEDESLLTDMAARAQLVEVPKGTVLFREGSVLRDCYCLVEGIIRISFQLDGEEITEALRDDLGAMLYPCIMVTGREDCANATVSCLTDTRLLHIRAEELCELRQTYPDFDGLQLQLVLQFVEQSFKIHRQIDHMNPTQRYAWFVENSPYLAEHVPQKYIASFLGMTPVSLSRIRSKLREDAKAE